MRGLFLYSLKYCSPAVCVEPKGDVDCFLCVCSSWGLVQPGILSVPELCHHMAEAWVSATVLASSVVQYKRQNPGTVNIICD